MAPQIFSLVPRDIPVQGAASQNKVTPVMIAGIVVACVIVLGVALWLGIRFYRQRVAEKREENLGSAFLSVRGIVREGEKDSSDTLGVKGTFSRSQMSSNIVMPEKAILRTDASREEIIQHHQEEGTLPLPFAPFMGGGNLTVPTPEHSKTSNRSSTSSFLSIARNSIFSGHSSNRLSVASFTSNSSAGAGQRKVRQIFNPVLPDELVISLGESLMIVNSFDDGWCIVGRDGLAGEVELGAVPAWCFIKPALGLKAERPLRTASLGVTINLDVGPGARNDVMSWSNF